MVDWDALEDAGHELTHCGMLMAGTSLYYCEKCGAFMLCGHEGIEVFHLPPGSESHQGICRGPRLGTPLTSNHASLKSKLDALQAADWERLKEI